MKIDQRLEKHRKELDSLYRDLYGDEQALDALHQIILDADQTRPADLKKLDEKREENPDWYKDRNMYGITMYTDLFAGELKELGGRLDYLSEMGITYLHLMPLLRMPHPHNDGGYAVESFTEVDPTLGDNEDLKELTASLRERGISLCLDFIMNHTADTHDWAIKAKAGDRDFQNFYHLFENRDIPDEYEKTMPEVFPNTAPGNFTYNEELGKWVLTTFHPYQWDLNYNNPYVFNEMMKSILMLANLGVEVFRIDAVPYIWKELGTSCRNLPQVHPIVRMLRLILEIAAPATILKGEVVMAPKELQAYFGTKEHPECHLLYNVSTMVNIWSALASQDTRLLRRQLDSLYDFDDHCYFVNYLRCHDDIGWGLDEQAEEELGIDPFLHKQFLYQFYEGSYPGSYARGELYNYNPADGDARSCGTTASLCGIERAMVQCDPPALEESIKRDLLLHAVMFFTGGFPMLNSGDEIAQLNGWEYHLDSDKVEDSRNLHRTAFDWEKAKRRKQKGTVENRIYTGIQKLHEMRDHPCFQVPVRTFDTHDPGVLGQVRQNGRTTLIGLFNFTDTEKKEALWGEGTFTNVANGEKLNPDSIILPPYSFMYIQNQY